MSSHRAQVVQINVRGFIRLEDIEFILYYFSLRKNYIAIVMESESMRMLNVCILDYLTKMGMNESALVFAREAGVNHAVSGLNLSDDFLSDWWCLFWDSYSRANDVVDVRGSFVQGQTLFRSQGMFQPPSQGMIQPLPRGMVQVSPQVPAQGMVQAPVQAQSLGLDQTLSRSYAQASYQVQGRGRPRAQAEIQARGSTAADNRMLSFELNGNSLGQIRPPRFYFNNRNMLSEPILASTWNAEQRGVVLPCISNSGFQPGRALPQHSRNHRFDPTLISQQLHQINRAQANLGLIT
ncbi:hypothetical protein QVD17_21437 [Tagetes erecta]|uniref:LisH domain-containing protein n=1 Tax=Tagetes erecta TaxID=13708 RepID=A0AAD8KC21_TARER|nr:hypothetical protein QVD17_21437 [Tagetes erecta]